MAQERISTTVVKPSQDFSSPMGSPDLMTEPGLERSLEYFKDKDNIIRIKKSCWR